MKDDQATMIRMIRSCDASQRKFAIFLIVVMVTEITLICSIVDHEHQVAHAEQRNRLNTRLLGNKFNNVSVVKGAARIPLQRNRSFTEVSSQGKYHWNGNVSQRTHNVKQH